MSAAAEDLHLSKAMVSKHIRQLEEKLGCRLLDRGGRGVRLTEAGALYQQRCQHILAALEEAELVVTRRASEPLGTLRVTAPTFFGSNHLAPLIAQYEAAYPGVCVHLSLSDRVVDLASEGFALAIRVGSLPDSSLIARKIASTRLVVCSAPSYLQRRGTPQTPQDLVDHNCLVHKPSTPRDTWSFKGSQGGFSVRVSGDLEANVGEPLRLAAIGGRGLVQLATYVVGPDIATGSLVTALDAYEPDAIPIHALYLDRRHLSAAVRSFVEFLQTRFQIPASWDPGKQLARIGFAP